MVVEYPFPDFNIKPKGKISGHFLKNYIQTFKQATGFIQNLPYGRNANKEDLSTLFADGCGTCSTKHAILKLLADENNFKGISLVCGLFKMNGKNTPEIAERLTEHGLEYLPEAHNYLKYEDRIYDFTTPALKGFDFADDLIEEIEIRPDQITEYKVNYHKQFLKSWLETNSNIKYSLSELWSIREQCIQDLTDKADANFH